MLSSIRPGDIMLSVTALQNKLECLDLASFLRLG